MLREVLNHLPFKLYRPPESRQYQIPVLCTILELSCFQFQCLPLKRTISSGRFSWEASQTRVVFVLQKWKTEKDTNHIFGSKRRVIGR